jgi:hypothetical protein
MITDFEDFCTWVFVVVDDSGNRLHLYFGTFLHKVGSIDSAETSCELSI